MLHLVQYFYIDKSNSKYGVGTTNFKRKNEYYFRCIYTFYRSVIDLNKKDDYKLYFVCNEVDEPEFIKNFSFKKFLLENNITIIRREPKYVQYQDKWSGSTYLFDAIEAIYEHLKRENFDNEDAYFLFFDNDVIFTQKLKSIDFLKQKSDVFAYKLGKINNDPFNEIDPSFLNDSNFEAYGGEFFGLRYGAFERFLEIFKSIYPCPWLKTEEHYLSYIINYRLSGLTLTIANPEMKRIWTTYSYSNLEKGDEKYKIIHIPSEKEESVR